MFTSNLRSHCAGENEDNKENNDHENKVDGGDNDVNDDANAQLMMTMIIH